MSEQLQSQQEAPTSDARSSPESMASDGGETAAASAVPQGQSVIPIINKLMDIFGQLGAAQSIDLPQVAVVGSQSSGKSSVLEALVGRNFLPRGADICTRRPLVLQLVQSKVADAAQEWGEFLHLPGKRFTDFNRIREEIQAETERETGANRGISEKQIRLKICSPHVLNITLVDLPGVTKVPVGDQPGDIEARVRTMILSYIRHETCIILAVSPANADLANSDALQMARLADPDGSRTIGVITKLDIMDRGTDARNLLLGNVIPLRLGYVGVVNRSQEDIARGKPVKEGLLAEEAYFCNRPVYHSIADRCGIQQLARKLNLILVQHIRMLLPELKARINAQMVSVQKELAGYGEMTTDKAGQGVLLLSILTRYTNAFATIVDGKNEGMSTTELNGGARIHYIFQAIFVKSLEEVDPCEDLTDGDIRTAIQNAAGPKNVLFVPEVPFEVLLRRQIARLLDPSLQCARFIYDELVKISHHCESHELQRFPMLRRRMEETVASFLREGLAPAETMIAHIINMEMDYINTSHPNFIGGSKAVEAALKQARSPSKEAHDWKETTGPAPYAAGGGPYHHGAAAPSPDRSSSAAAALAAERPKSRAILARGTNATSSAAAAPSRQPSERPGPSGAGSWGIPSIFGSSERVPKGGSRGAAPPGSVFGGDVPEPPPSIHLKEPPAVLRASEEKTEQEVTEIAVTRLLLTSYYDIVRKNIQDAVPKAIMHFLVNQVKRELHSVFIRALYREPLFEEMLQEREEVALKRKHCKEVFRVLQQASWTLEELPLDPEQQHGSGSGAGLDATGIPRSAYNLAADFTAALPNPYASSGGYQPLTATGGLGRAGWRDTSAKAGAGTAAAAFSPLANGR